MIDKETYLNELKRYFDSVREDGYDDKLENPQDCYGVYCKNCIFKRGAYCVFILKDIFDALEILEKWSKEHQPKKYQVSRLEYDILKIYIEAECHGYFYEYGVIMEILKKGYFKGANGKMKIEYYFNNCEVVEND